MPNYDSDKEYGKSAQCFKIYYIYTQNDLTLSCIKCKTIKNKES